MLNRPEYKQLVKRVRETIEEMKNEGSGLVAITPGVFSYSFAGKRRDFEQSWPRVMQEHVFSKERRP